jgi:C1A family cysteine protease
MLVLTLRSTAVEFTKQLVVTYVGHAVLIVGYDERKYWITKNSGVKIGGLLATFL